MSYNQYCSDLSPREADTGEGEQHLTTPSHATVLQRSSDRLTDACGLSFLLPVNRDEAINLTYVTSPFPFALLVTRTKGLLDSALMMPLKT